MIEALAFCACTGLEEVVIPNGNVQIGAMAFDECDNVILSVVEGSPAHTYAQNEGIAFVVR